MNIFYNIRTHKAINVKHLIVLTCMFFATFIALAIGVNFGIPAGQANYFWQTIIITPIFFGTLTYLVLGISLSFLTYRSLAKIICFTAVITDIRNKGLVNGLLFNLFLLNAFASTMILGYVGLYLIEPSEQIAHIAYLLLISFIIPITYCMLILEGCIDKLVNLEIDVEMSCINFINQIH